MSDNGVDTLPEDVMNHVISGDDDYTRDLARLLNIDLNDPAQKMFIYAMEYMKYGNMNVIHLLAAVSSRCHVHLWVQQRNSENIGPQKLT